MWIYTCMLLLSTIFSSNTSTFDANEADTRGENNHGKAGVQGAFLQDAGSGEVSEALTEVFSRRTFQSPAGDWVENTDSILTSPRPEQDQEFVTINDDTEVVSKDELRTGIKIQDELSRKINIHEKELQGSPERNDVQPQNIVDMPKNRHQRGYENMKPTREPLFSKKNSPHFLPKRKLWYDDIRRTQHNIRDQVAKEGNENSQTDTSQENDYDRNNDDDDPDSVYTLVHFRYELYDYVKKQISAVNESLAELLMHLQQKVSQLETRMAESMAYTSVLETKIRLSATPEQGDIRLLSRDSCGRVSRAGYLLFYTGTTWGFVCDDFFNASAVKVACSQLGYPQPRTSLEPGLGMSPSPADVSMKKRWQDSYQIVLDDVQCSGRERTLDSCSHLKLGQHDCSLTEVVYLSC